MALYPKAIVEHVGVGDDDDVDRLRRGLDPFGRRGRRRFGGVGLSGSSLGRFGLGRSPLLRIRIVRLFCRLRLGRLGLWRTVGKRGLDRAPHPGGEYVAFVVRFELGKEPGDIGQSDQLLGCDLGRIGRGGDQRLDRRLGAVERLDDA